MFSLSVKRYAAIVSGALMCLGAAAVPPLPGFIKVSQPDGSTFEARIIGDEHFHYYETVDGKYLVADPSDGFFKPAAIDASGRVVAASSDRCARTVYSADEFRSAAVSTFDERKEQSARRAPSRIAPGVIRRDFPTTGTVRGLIVMAEFEDVKFQPEATREYFDAKVNDAGYTGAETYGSVNDYFKEQSGGVFTPEFDIVGPVTLPHTREWYGYEEKLDDLFRDAAYAAKESCGADFTRYDVNDDYFVDFFFVIFAGHGEAQGGSADCIWPAMKDLSDYVPDAFDGMYLGVAACSSELKGGSGTVQDGVGTICHEFSHILGLPDVYDAMNTGGYGMGHFDMLCYGPYNDGGRTPCGYTAMEKYTLGWIEPVVLEEPEHNVTLGNFSTTNDCRFIVNPDNKNEYYTLENRQLVGFDSALPGHGLVISYIHYDRSLWAKNCANSPSLARYERISIVPADNTRAMWIQTSTVSQPGSEDGDPWPGVKERTEFTDETAPAAVWRSTGAGVGKPITNIRENADGTVSFDFNYTSSVADIIADADGTETFYNLQGIEVPASCLVKGVYIVRNSAGDSRKVSIR